MFDFDLARAFLTRHPADRVFVTVSGAHLYGFHSPDSDYDLRGCHVTPVREFVSMDPPSETLEVMDKSGFPEMDVVTHDVLKFFRLMLKRNGYVLEQVFSPLVVHDCGVLEELRHLARGCMTRHHRYHYRGFAENQWELVVRSPRPTVKGLLYTYRVLLAGIHLLETGMVESNLRVLNERARLAYIDDLIARKVSGNEKDALRPGELERHELEFVRLRDELNAASERSSLPEEPTREAVLGLDDLAVRLRLER
ncbi:MAG TPA: nucleotidyltransferase domain-containing protein [Phycisphaerales bacterium]|nr:nucleotidyltransferase domain-containing protein [Phycisphaerales bacterium]